MTQIPSHTKTAMGTSLRLIISIVVQPSRDGLPEVLETDPRRGTFRHSQSSAMRISTMVQVAVLLLVAMSCTNPAKESLLLEAKSPFGVVAKLFRADPQGATGSAFVMVRIVGQDGRSYDVAKFSKVSNEGKDFPRLNWVGDELQISATSARVLEYQSYCYLDPSSSPSKVLVRLEIGTLK